MKKLLVVLFALLSAVFLGACSSPATPTYVDDQSGGQEPISAPTVDVPTQPEANPTEPTSRSMQLSVSILNSIPPEDVLAEVRFYGQPGGGDGPQPIVISEITDPSLILDGNQLIFVKFQPYEKARLFVYRIIDDTKVGKMIGWTNVQVDENGALTININDVTDTYYAAIGEVSGEVLFYYKSGWGWPWEGILASKNPPISNTDTLEIYYPLAACAGSRLHQGDTITVEQAAEYVTIRSTADTHPHDNKIGRISVGEQAKVIDGPVCNYGWILWKIKKDSDGMIGWVPESDGKEFWFLPVK